MAGKLSIDPFKGIIVQIISKGTVLDLYNDPDLSEEDDPYASQKYIEVTAGSTFQVKVLLTSDFQLYNIQPRDTVCVTLGIDGSDVFRTAKQESRRTIERYATSGRPTTFEFSNFDHFSEAGEWIRSDYSFGNLNLQESAETGFSVARAQNLGKIQIAIARVHCELTAPFPRSTKVITATTEIPEKVLKGKAIAHTVRLTGGRSIDAPKPHSCRIQKIDGEEGKSMVYNILYRSKQALQSLGCIPPDQVTDTVLIENDHNHTARNINDGIAPTEALQEIKALRTKLTLLERNFNVTAGSPSASALIKSEAASKIKRESEENENLGPRQRRRTSVKVETVDLTDD